ncbi:MAG: citrate/2-methylcitrate synthase, partial [Nitrososphaerota archaeon]
MSHPQLHKGLDDVIIKETALSYIDGEAGKLFYVGYPIEELVEHSTYEEVCFLLLHQRLPTVKELEEFSSLMRREAYLPQQFNQFLDSIPETAHIMDVLKTTIDFLALYDEELMVHDEKTNIMKAVRLIAKIPLAIAYVYRHKSGLKTIEPLKTLPHAANFLYMVTGERP